MTMDNGQLTIKKHKKMTINEIQNAILEFTDTKDLLKIAHYAAGMACNNNGIFGFHSEIERPVEGTNTYLRCIMKYDVEPKEKEGGNG